MKNYKYLLIFLTFFLFGFLIWSIIDVFLKHSPKLFSGEKNEFEYFSINLNKIFPSNPTKNNKLIKSSSSIYKYTLKGLYQDKNSGFVILQKNTKTYFVDLNSAIEGYKLIKIYQNSAVFEKNKQKYILKFKKIKVPKITQEDNQINNISKNTFEEYRKNPSKIWKEIGIIKTKKGYIITYVKPKSIFQKLGLKKGDILLEVNSIALKTDADAWRAYNNVTKNNYVSLKIKRNNQIKVLHYEIY